MIYLFEQKIRKVTLHDSITVNANSVNNIKFDIPKEYSKYSIGAITINHEGGGNIVLNRTILYDSYATVVMRNLDTKAITTDISCTMLLFK